MKSREHQAKRAIREQSEGGVNSIIERSECGIVTRLLLTSDRLLVLKHPLLLSIIYIIESGLQLLLSQAASAVCSARRKSDCFLCSVVSSPFHTSLHPFTFVTSYSFLHLLTCNISHSYICNILMFVTSSHHLCCFFSHSSAYLFLSVTYVSPSNTSLSPLSLF